MKTWLDFIIVYGMQMVWTRQALPCFKHGVRHQSRTTTRLPLIQSWDCHPIKGIRLGKNEVSMKRDISLERTGTAVLWVPPPLWNNIKPWCHLWTQFYDGAKPGFWTSTLMMFWCQIIAFWLGLWGIVGCLVASLSSRWTEIIGASKTAQGQWSETLIRQSYCVQCPA